MGWLAQVVGAGLVLLAIADIYLTVLYPRGGRGVVSVPLNRGIWQIFQLSASFIPKRGVDAQRLRVRDRLLSYMGPTLLVTTVAMWISLLILGFALIFWPALGNQIRIETGATPTDFATAIYYSGYALTTLGTGEITPQTSTYRLLMVLEAVLGFSVLTMTLTYFSSVYSHLIERNTFALSIHHRTAKTADAAELLARIGASGYFDGSAREDISNMAQKLLNIIESHHSYPTLGYFRWQEAYYALARITFIIMDTATLIRSALSQEKYHSLVRSAAVRELEESGMHFLGELSDSFLPKRHRSDKARLEEMWRDRYYRALDRLEAEGIETVMDREAGAEQYVCLRGKWNFYIVELAKYMGYKWSAIAPADCDRAYLQQ